MTDRSIDRRVFVKAGGLALVSLGIDPIFLTRAAYAVRRPDGPANAKKTLICVFQRGAVDGLNMIVPHGDPSYYRLVRASRSAGRESLMAPSTLTVTSDSIRAWRLCCPIIAMAAWPSSTR